MKKKQNAVDNKSIYFDFIVTSDIPFLSDTIIDNTRSMIPVTRVSTKNNKNVITVLIKFSNQLVHAFVCDYTKIKSSGVIIVDSIPGYGNIVVLNGNDYVYKYGQLFTMIYADDIDIPTIIACWTK